MHSVRCAALPSPRFGATGFQKVKYIKYLLGWLQYGRSYLSVSQLISAVMHQPQLAAAQAIDCPHTWWSELVFACPAGLLVTVATAFLSSPLCLACLVLQLLHVDCCMLDQCCLCSDPIGHS